MSYDVMCIAFISLEPFGSERVWEINPVHSGKIEWVQVLHHWQVRWLVAAQIFLSVARTVLWIKHIKLRW